jgi:catechol 2,3-dioxygenase-like lactoylglutathione lyase family enzyme
MAECPVVDQLNLVVSDMEASLAFYRLLGVEPVETSPEWEPLHRSAPAGVDLDFDSTRFARFWDAGSSGPGVVIGFKVASPDAVDETFARLTGAGYRGRQEPFDAFWGARYAIVEDPDGNAVGLMSPVDPARRRPPPDPSGF